MFLRVHPPFGTNIRVTAHNVISENDLVCLRWSVTLRHTGAGLGTPPTGKEVHASGISMVRFSDGRFAEAWQNWDMLGVMEQIGGTARSKVYIAGH